MQNVDTMLEEGLAALIAFSQASHLGTDGSDDDDKLTESLDQEQERASMDKANGCTQACCLV
jgi:hypothetical protein